MHQNLQAYAALESGLLMTLHTEKVLLKVLVKVWHTFGFHLLVLVLPILFHEVYVLVLTILFKSIVNNTGHLAMFITHSEL